MAPVFHSSPFNGNCLTLLGQISHDHGMRRFDPTSIPRPHFETVNWPETNKPVALEIGAGTGWHAIRYAKTYPGRQLIAIERTQKFHRLQNRLRHHPQLKNLLIVRGDAIAWVTHHVPPHSVESCFLLYPNPYPKNRQRNQRWHNMPFMGYLRSRLKPDGQITIATNEDFYRQEAVHFMTHIWRFKLLENRQLSISDTPRTHFEKKYLSRGQPCWNLIFRSTVSN